MSVYLCGGALAGTPDAVLDPFRTEAAARGGRVVVVLADRDGSAERFSGEYADAFGAEVVAARDGRPVDPSVFAAVAGIVVGGGHTPRYHAALVDSFGAVADAVTAGAPYLGFSAGAMVAGSPALLGGHLLGDLEVLHEDCSEDLGPLTVDRGLGLVPWAVDVHAAQAGTLTRALALVEAGLAPRAVAVDEGTALVCGYGDAAVSVIGEGSAWFVEPGPQGLVVSRRTR